jgi:hypothetical protein
MGRAENPGHREEPSMLPLNRQDRLVQLNGQPGTWYRLQRCGGHNSRLQHVNLSAGTYYLADSFLAANGTFTAPITYAAVVEVWD